eukprot:g33362.t1
MVPVFTVSCLQQRNGEPEDELRRLVIAYYLADDEVAVFEVPVRNSGHMGGRFSEKRRMKNPDTGEYFKIGEAWLTFRSSVSSARISHAAELFASMSATKDLFVGQTVTIASQPLRITRADEHCLQYLEAHPDEFPYASPGFTGNARTTTLAFKVAGNLKSQVDLKRTPAPTEHSRYLASLMKTGGWRTFYKEEEDDVPTKDFDIVPKNMRHPRLSPAWLKHEKQVLRWYGFFQETVTESAMENSRYRHVYIMYFMEDGTVGINEPKDEEIPIDTWQTNYRIQKARDRGGLPVTKGVMDDKAVMRALGGIPPVEKKFAQFLLNDRKVLRFKGYWDDHTPYGTRFYFILHYYLADNTVEINEAHCRNSGRDGWPIFMKRGPLHKRQSVALRYITEIMPILRGLH